MTYSNSGIALYLTPIIVSVIGGIILFLIMKTISKKTHERQKTSKKDTNNKHSRLTTLNTSYKPEEYDPRSDDKAIYIWAAQGPFEKGADSALAMASAITVLYGGEKLNSCKGIIISHEINFNKHPYYWEKIRKESARRSIKKFGSQFNKEITQAETLTETQGIYKNKFLLKISQDLSHEAAKIKELKLGTPLEENEKRQQPALSEKINYHTEYQGSRINKSMHSAGSIIELITIIVVFLASWGSLIAGNFVLGLAFGWIPALIVAFMAAALLPLAIILLVFATIIISIAIATAVFFEII